MRTIHCGPCKATQLLVRAYSVFVTLPVHRSHPITPSSLLFSSFSGACVLFHAWWHLLVYMTDTTTGRCYHSLLHWCIEEATTRKSAVRVVRDVIQPNTGSFKARAETNFVLMFGLQDSRHICPACTTPTPSSVPLPRVFDRLRRRSRGTDARQLIRFRDCNIARRTNDLGAVVHETRYPMAEPPCTALQHMLDDWAVIKP